MNGSFGAQKGNDMTSLTCEHVPGIQTGAGMPGRRPRAICDVAV